MRAFRLSAALLCLPALLGGGSGLSPTAMAMLQDAQGWEYIAVFDNDNGMQMNHACFVEGRSDHEACHGTMTFTADRAFAQNVYIHGTLVQRHGTYQLEDKSLTLFDELGTKDGPYDLDIKIEAKTMRMSMRQAGVLIGADFKLETEYKKDRERKKQKDQ